MLLKNIAPPPGKIVTLADGREIRVFPILGITSKVDALLSDALAAPKDSVLTQLGHRAQTGLYLAYATGQDVDSNTLAEDLTAAMRVGCEFFDAFGQAFDGEDTKRILDVAVSGQGPLARGSHSQIGG
jgi:hypothetical protein